MTRIIAILMLLLAVPGAYAQRTNPAVLDLFGVAETVFDNGGAPWPFLAQINAKNYDKGGQGIAYNQPLIGPPSCAAVPPAGQAYRPDFVNLYTSTDDAVGLQVGCNLPGDYYKYQITVPASTPGPYILNLRVANPNSRASQTGWQAFIDDVSIGSAAGVQTADSNTFAVLQIGAPSGFNVTQGQHTLKLTATGAVNTPAGDISWFQALPGGQSISSIAPTMATVNGPCADGTVIDGNLTATLTPPTPQFSGTWILSNDTTHFRLGGSGPAGTTLLCNGSVGVGSYSPIVTAHESGLADKQQIIAVTVQSGLVGTCGAGQFSGSSCPPLPSGKTQWTYVGGSEFTVVPDWINDPHWNFGPQDQQASSGIGCTVNTGHLSVSASGLTMTGADASECNATGRAAVDDKCMDRGGSSGSFCVGPTLKYCMVAPPTATSCNPINPGGLYIEARLTGNAYYWAFWQEGLVSNCSPASPSNGVEVDTVEVFGTVGGGHIFWGDYTNCLMSESPQYNNPTDFSSVHNAGVTLLPDGSGVTFYDDGVNMHNFPISPMEPDAADVDMFLWADSIDGHGGGSVTYSWLRIYRAE